MIKTAIAAAVTVLAVAAAPASADYAQQHDAMKWPTVQTSLRVANAYWAAKGLVGPPVRVLSAPSLMDTDGMDADGRANPGTPIWIRYGLLLEMLADRDPDSRQADRQYICGVIVHERGHTLGLSHGTGIMAPVINSVPRGCRLAFPLSRPNERVSWG